MPGSRTVAWRSIPMDPKSATVNPSVFVIEMATAMTCSILSWGQPINRSLEMLIRGRHVSGFGGTEDEPGDEESAWTPALVIRAEPPVDQQEAIHSRSVQISELS